MTAYNLAYANSNLNLNYPCNKLGCYFRKICARIFCTRIIPIGVALKNICTHGNKSTVSFGYIRKKSMTLFNISRDKRSSLAFKYKQNVLNFDYNLSHTGELWLQSLVVQISCSELYWFVFRVKCGSSFVGTTPRSWIVLGCASRLWREANERAKYMTTFEGHATRNRAEYLLSSRIHTWRAHLARFPAFRRI